MNQMNDMFGNTNVTIDEIEKYVDLLYEKPEEKIKGARFLLYLVLTPENINTICEEHEKLLDVISRTLRDEHKKILELSKDHNIYEKIIKIPERISCRMHLGAFI